jgi:hypothetical protein
VYNNNLTILGRFSTQVDYAKRRNIEFYFVDGSGGNLISYATSVELGIINPIKPNKNHKIINRVEAQGYARIFPRLFSGLLGLLKGFQAKFEVKSDVAPRQQKLRPIPYHLRDSVAEEIKSMIDEDIIEPAPGVIATSSTQIRLGLDNIADYFSRNPIEPPDSKYEDLSERFIASINIGATGVDTDELVAETDKDTLLIELKKAVMNEQYTQSEELNRYLKQIDQISIASNGLLLRNNRIIVPKSLQQKVVDIGHCGH